MVECIKSHLEEKPHQSQAFGAHLQNIFLHSSNLMFVHCQTCSTKHNDTSGKEVQSCPWKHLQATTSISKYPPTSRSLILNFLPTAIALTHEFSSSAVSGPPCLLLCTKLALLLEKKKWDGYLRFQLDTKWIVLPHDTNPASWEPTEKRAALLFHSSRTLEHCYFWCLSAYTALMPYGIFY